MRLFSRKVQPKAGDCRFYRLADELPDPFKPVGNLITGNSGVLCSVRPNFGGELPANYRLAYFFRIWRKVVKDSQSVLTYVVSITR